MQHQLSVSLRSSLVLRPRQPPDRSQSPGRIKLYNIAVTDTHCHDPLKIDILDVETHVLRRVAEEVVLVDVVRLEDGVEGGKAGVEAWK